jgi:hypothetical protein
MKLRKEIGSEAVRDIILEARARVATLPPVDIRDPWPSYRELEVEATPIKTEESTEQHQ